MPGHGQIQLRKVFEMLSACAAGYTAIETRHHWRIHYRKQTSWLPKGEHSRQGNLRAEIDLGKVKSICRRFDILDCAKRTLSQLR